MLGTLDLAGSEHWALFNLISLEHIIMQQGESLFLIQTITGLLIFRGKKNQNFAGFSGANSRKNRPISRDFTGKKSKFTEKSADFAGFSREKSQNSQKNRPISWDFSGKKSNFERLSGANS